MYIGPTWPVENGSVMGMLLFRNHIRSSKQLTYLLTGPLHAVVNYTIKIIKKMQRENIKSWVPRQDATDRFNEHAQTWIKGSVWEDDCNAWCKL